MPSITFTATAANITRLVDATCAIRGYQAMIDDPNDPNGPQIPNPQTKAQFAKQWWWEEMKKEVRTHEANEAARIARETSGTLGTGE